MAYPQLESVNATEINQLMAYTSTVVPIFWPLVLFGFFIIVAMGSYFSQKRLTQTGDFLASMTASAYVTTILATTLFLIPGVIQLYVLITTMVITFVITIIFINSRDKL